MDVDLARRAALAKEQARGPNGELPDAVLIEVAQRRDVGTVADGAGRSHGIGRLVSAAVEDSRESPFARDTIVRQHVVLGPVCIDVADSGGGVERLPTPDPDARRPVPQVPTIPEVTRSEEVPEAIARHIAEIGYPVPQPELGEGYALEDL